MIYIFDEDRCNFGDISFREEKELIRWLLIVKASVYWSKVDLMELIVQNFAVCKLNVVITS